MDALLALPLARLRREAEMRRERDARRGALAQLRFIEFVPNVRELAAPDREDRAA